MEKSNNVYTPHRITKFLWWCAGADEELLTAENGCPPSDRVKYIGMGGVILATGVLAALSSGFAFYTIFGPKGEAVKSSTFATFDKYLLVASICGFFWGLMIFNLDRFIISSGGKGDMKEGFSWEDLKQSWPRFLMAVILGITISAPLEVRIMKTEIDAELSSRQEKYEFKLNKESDSLIDAKIINVHARLDPVQKQIKDKQDYVEKRRLEIKEQRKQLELEAEGKTASGIAGRGPAWKDKRENLDKMELELDALAVKYSGDEQVLKQRIQGYEKEIAIIEAERSGKYKLNKLRANQLDGLVERLSIAHEKSLIISLFITLMFIVIEITPLIFKMMMTKTPYDYLAENKNRLIYAKNGILFRSEPHKDALGKEVEIISYEMPNREAYKSASETKMVQQQIDNYLQNNG